MQDRYSGQVIWEMLAAVQEAQAEPLEACRAFAESVVQMYPPAQEAVAAWRLRQYEDAVQEELVAACIAHTQCLDGDTWSAWWHWLLWQGQRRYRATLNDPASMAAWVEAYPATAALALGRALEAAFAPCGTPSFGLPDGWWPATLEEANPWCKDRVPQLCRALGWAVEVVEGHAVSDNVPWLR